MQEGNLTPESKPPGLSLDIPERNSEIMDSQTQLTSAEASINANDVYKNDPNVLTPRTIYAQRKAIREATALQVS